ncbi:penicillin-binding protein 1B [Entomomonas moraniae]|uniref:Penicillin-binding protein 1B n=1 Tax=Entomomonas moraniae TaxID=2213226 RepID=A0A451EPD1_9GAMM|nr:penicillin-binding protein 1B [Entomomonas moraniae]AZS51655.1 penicillin-binding protein 1B [Entomomonas moraniae]
MERSKKKRVKKTKKQSSRWLVLFGWIFKLSLVAIVVIAPYIIYLDAVVQDKFSGKRWTIPAKVYARPLELYKGQKLSKEDFLTELNALGYSSVVTVNNVGQMHVEGNDVSVYVRGFHFYEGKEPAKLITVSFSGNTVSQITDSKNQKIPLVRLDPMLIGGVYPAHNEDRILVKLDQVPPLLVRSLVAVEDKRFYKHHGISMIGIARAVYTNIVRKKLSQGGSTLTQQLVKNFYLTNERTVKRKANEAIMSLLLEMHYDKNEILEAYLNEVFLAQDGQRSIHGFGLASQYFFGQPISELKLPQIALLVGMVKGPSYYNPRRNPKLATERRNVVLDVLAEQNIISANDAAKAKAAPLGVIPQGRLGISSFPAFIDLVKRQLREDYKEEDLTEEGLRIFTSLDPIIQIKAERALDGTLKRLGNRANDLEAAMVITNPSTGELLGLIGSRDRNYVGFNRAIDAIRPIGSQMKPAVYLTALESLRYTLTTFIQDEPYAVPLAGGKEWRPQNFDRKFHGNIFFFQALANSFNVSTVRIGMDVGVANVLKTIKRLGVNNDYPAYPAMLLGSASMTPMDVSKMFQTIANGGYDTTVRSIRNVLDAKGNRLGRYPYETQQRFDAGAIYLLQFAMQRVMREGTGRSAYNQVPSSINLAGKTGTSNDLKDSWFTGFGQDILATVWLGKDDNSNTSLTGASGSLQVWSSFMKEARPTSLNMPLPSNVVYAWVDAETGEGSGEDCPNAIQIPYIKGTAPAPALSCKRPDGSTTDWIRGWIN